MTDDLRTRIAAALEECRTLIPEVQADAVMAIVGPELARLDRRETPESRVRDAAASSTSVAEVAEKLGVGADYVRQLLAKMPDGKQIRADLGFQPQWNVPRTAFGEEKTLREWTEDPRCVMPYKAVKSRLELGWTLEDALTTPRLSNRWERSHHMQRALSGQEIARIRKLTALAATVRSQTPADSPARAAAQTRDEIILSLRAEGMTVVHVADQLGFKRITVQKWVDRLAAAIPGDGSEDGAP